MWSEITNIRNDVAKTTAVRNEQISSEGEETGRQNNRSRPVTGKTSIPSPSWCGLIHTPKAYVRVRKTKTGDCCEKLARLKRRLSSSKKGKNDINIVKTHAQFTNTDKKNNQERTCEPDLKLTFSTRLDGLTQFWLNLHISRCQWSLHEPPSIYHFLSLK